MPEAEKTVIVTNESFEWDVGDQNHVMKILLSTSNEGLGIFTTRTP